MLRDFKIAVGGGGHIVIKRAVAQVGTICAENQGTGTECGKNQRTDKALAQGTNNAFRHRHALPPAERAAT